MSHQLIHTSLEAQNQAFPRRLRQSDAACGTHEVTDLYYAVVDRAYHDGVSENGTKLLHQIERERRPSEMGLMVEAEHPVETDRANRERELLGQQRVAE